MDELKEKCAILDAIPYPIVFVDTDHIVRYMNRNAYDRYGDKILGRSIFDCHNPKSREKMKEIFDRLKAGEDSIFEGFGRERRERLYTNAVRDENGVLIGYFERHEPNIQL